MFSHKLPKRSFPVSYAFFFYVFVFASGLTNMPLCAVFLDKGLIYISVWIKFCGEDGKKKSITTLLNIN